MTLDIKRILVPLDFSANSELVLDYARAMAQRFGAALHLLHVCEVPPLIAAPADTFATAYADWSECLADDAGRQLVALQKRLPEVRTSTEVVFGNPAKCIVTAANLKRCDLIVMGTHGHGPIMHMLMGNVAERVVRAAPCPVLTVREPRETLREVEAKRAAVTAFARGVLMLVLLVLLLPAQARAQGTAMTQLVPGGELFRTYCATCHGASARGDGPLASSMTRKPADLTEIARRNGGLYPSGLVFRIIDGKKPVRGHGGADMPEWGDAFARSRDGGDAETVRRMIQALVEYLESLQAKTVR
jgi:nucleotide-binding universal stress UspA family protein/mono/diheme cytochrome c family protein